MRGYCGVAPSGGALPHGSPLQLARPSGGPARGWAWWRGLVSQVGWGSLAVIAGVAFGTLALVGPGAALAVMFGAIAFVLMVRFPAMVLVALYLGITFANSGLLSVQFGMVWTTAKIAMVGGAVAWFVHALSSRQPVARVSGIAVPMGLLLMAVVMAWSWARRPAPGTAQEIAGFAGLLVMVVLIDTILRPRYLNAMHRALAVVLVGILAYDLVFGSAGHISVDAYRATGVFDDPNFWCAFLLTVAPPAVVALQLDESWASRAVLVGVLALVPVSIIATLSRGGFVTMVLITPFVLYGLWKRWPLLVVASVVAVVVAMLTLDLGDVYARHFTLVDADVMETDGSVRDRSLSQAVAWDLFLSRPWFGWGTGSFSYESMVRSHGAIDISPHNTYLRVLVEQGVVGAVAGASVLLFTAWKLVRMYLSAPTRRLRVWAVGLGGSYLAFLASAGLLNMLAFGMSFFYLGIIVAVSRFVYEPLDELEEAGLAEPGATRALREAREREQARQEDLVVPVAAR